MGGRRTDKSQKIFGDGVPSLRGNTTDVFWGPRNHLGSSTNVAPYRAAPIVSSNGLLRQSDPPEGAAADRPYRGRCATRRETPQPRPTPHPARSPPPPNAFLVVQE